GSVASITEAMPEGTYCSAEERSVGRDEHAQRGDGDAAPLGRRGTRLPAQAHEAIEQPPGDEEAHSRGEERGDLEHRDPDREERRAPEEVDGHERQRYPRVEAAPARARQRPDNL